MQPQVTFNDVAGQDEAKTNLREIVDFLRNPMKYHKIGARVPRAILLVGQPGTGKTLLARAVAGEAGVPFFTISASEFVKTAGESGAGRVHHLFQRARASSPSLVFIDDLDAVVRKCGAGLGSTNDEREQAINQLLVEIDGFDDQPAVAILAATNRPDTLDTALLRPGRFNRQVTVGLPDRRSREGILSIHTRHLRLASNVDLGIIARSTLGFSGADLANLCNAAALVAARSGHEQVNMTDFETALDRILLGATHKRLPNDYDRRVMAYHEAGHALVAWLSPSADPVHQITIFPHGRTTGVTEQLPGDDHGSYSKDYLLARLAILLGGRAGEELATGEITTGSENDLIEATRLARRMVARWGMGRLGLIAFDTREEQTFPGYEMSHSRLYSEATAARIDQDVQELLNDRYAAAFRLLDEARDPLDRLVDALLKDETINQEEMAGILGPRPYTAEVDSHLPVKWPHLNQG
jgi:cell division protease FtsH